MIKLPLKLIKIMKTCNLYLCFFILGSCFAIPGPTLIDLTYLVKTEIKSVAYIYTGRAAGGLLGSFIGGIFLDYTPKKDIVLTIFSCITSISMFAIPWSRQIVVLAIWMVVNGFSVGVLVTGGNVCCLNLWGKKNGPFYQALHLAFGLGGFTAPLIAAPFLAHLPTENALDNSKLISNNQTIDEIQTDYDFANISSSIESPIPSVTYAYSIIGIFAFLVTILFFIISIIAPKDEKEIKSTTSSSRKRNVIFLCNLVMLTCFMLLMSMGTEIGYAQMLTAYAVKGPLQLTTTLGSYMTSGYWISFTISRLITIFLVIKLNNTLLFLINIALVLTGSLTLQFVAPYYESGLWLSSVLLGSGISFFYPAVVSWLDKYITVTGKIASMFSVACSFGGMLIPYVITHFMDEAPEVFCYVNIVSTVSIAIVFSMMYLILKNVPDKYALQETKAENASAAYSSDNYM